MFSFVLFLTESVFFRNNVWMAMYGNPILTLSESFLTPVILTLGKDLSSISSHFRFFQAKRLALTSPKTFDDVQKSFSRLVKLSVWLSLTMGEIRLHWFLPVLQFIESQYWLCKGSNFPCVSKGWPWIASTTIEGWPWPVVGDWWWGEVPKPFLELLEVVVASRQLPSTAGSRRLLVRKARWGRRACKAPSQNEIGWKDACQFSI